MTKKEKKKKKSPVKIGDRIVNYIKKFYESNGFLVYKTGKVIVRFGPGSVRTKREDIFGIFDAIAVNKKEVHFIQVTTMGAKNKHIKKMKESSYLKMNPDYPDSFLYIYNKSGKIMFDIYKWNKTKKDFFLVGHIFVGGKTVSVLDSLTKL